MFRKVAHILTLEMFHHIFIIEHVLMKGNECLQIFDTFKNHLWQYFSVTKAACVIFVSK